ncbi:MAG: DNA polymerase III subunit gamma/tau, partial [Candidatus Kerfeldbacteria bacterium]|nr:DNA polymerase III subunit gamma/tau [Candidatus Kerfeldbacteria bacterium]
MSQDVLYRRYRPSRFADLVGQDHIRTTLEQEIARGRVAHAYLFTGPKGVGKTTTARLLAKALNCQKRKDGESEPCGTCPMCVALANGTALDLLEIDAASHTGVDHVREQIVDRAHFHPTQGAYKIYLIDEVHMLSLSAFNALLKTLEEPPSHVVFILATTEVHKVPETVISRCQRFDFRRIRHADLLARLQDLAKREKVKVAVPILKRIAAVSEGSLRDAESLLGQIIALGESVITEELASLIVPPSRVEDAVGLLQDIFAGNDAAALERINHLMDSGADPVSFARDVVAAARQLLLSRIDPSLVQYGTAALDDRGQKKLASWLATVPVSW